MSVLESDWRRIRDELRRGAERRGCATGARLAGSDRDELHAVPRPTLHGQTSAS